jgi:hypothetical protein
LSLQIPYKGGKVKLNFAYVSGLKCIGVKAFVEGDVSNRELFDATSLMDELFTADNGERCPTLAGETQLKMMEVKLSALTSTIGKPYKFAQRLCGLNVDGVMEFDGSPSSSTTNSTTQQFEFFVKVIDRVRERVSSRIKLTSCIREFEAGRPSKVIPDSLSHHIPVKVSSQLTSFKAIMLEEFKATAEAFPTYRYGVDRQSSNIDSGFHYQLKIGHGDFALGALLHVPANYPRGLPRFFVTVHGSLHQYNRTYVDAVQEVEKFINGKTFQMVGEDVNDLLSLQMNLLLSRLDVALEIASKRLNSNDFALEHVYGTFSSGRSQQFPFTYNPKKNFFI